MLNILVQMHYRCTASNRAIKNTAETTGDFINIQTNLKRTPRKIYSETDSQTEESIEITKNIYVSRKKIANY